MIYHKRHGHGAHRLLKAFVSFSGLYALCVFLYFTAMDKEDAIFFGHLALLFNYIAGIALVLFSLVLHRRSGAKEWGFGVLALAAVVPGYTTIIEDATMRYWGWEILYNSRVAAVYGVLIYSFLVYERGFAVL